MVREMAWFVDPFGFRHELIHGLATEPASFTPGRPGVQFVTGDKGLGHAVLIVPDWDEATRFFVDVLGFRISDDIETGITVRFLHCNPRHHSLAFSAVPGMSGFHHLMLEVTDPEQVRQAYYLVQQQHLPVLVLRARQKRALLSTLLIRPVSRCCSVVTSWAAPNGATTTPTARTTRSPGSTGRRSTMNF